MGYSQTKQESFTRAYDWEIHSPCYAVIDTIARFEEKETNRMAERLPPLNHTLDTDALDSLIRNNSTSTFSFEYDDYLVQFADEAVTISLASSPSN